MSWRFSELKSAILIAMLLLGWTSTALAQEVFAPRQLKATRAKPCADPECVETFWQDYDGPASKQWTEELKQERVDRRFALPVYVDQWPPRAFTVLGFVYVLSRPQTRDPKLSAVRALADLARRHGADAVSLRHRKVLGRWYVAGTAIKFRLRKPKAGK